jgi:hypothetical protein
MLVRFISLVSLLIFVNPAVAFSSDALHDDIPAATSWSVTASIGYTNFENMYGNEGQTAVGRLAFDKGLLKIKQFEIGAEFGIQNGNSMRLKVSQTDLDLLGGSPVQTTVNPILDLLATVMVQPLKNTPIFAQIKGGIAYRSWQFEDRTSINPVSNIAGEIQAGLGVAISKRSRLSLLYQGIFGGNSNFVVDSNNEVAHVSTIPAQNGILLSMNVLV